MANSKPRGKGVTLSHCWPSDGMICAMFIVGEVFMCDGGRSGSDVFFPAKNLRNVPREVVLCLHSEFRGTISTKIMGCEGYDFFW